MLQASVSEITLHMTFKPAFSLQGHAFTWYLRVLTSGKRQTSSTEIKFATIYLETFLKVHRLYRDLFLNLFYLLLLSEPFIWKYFCQVIISNLPLCIYNYMSFLPAVWKPQIATEPVLCWKMCTLTTQQLQRMWPAQLRALCKTTVAEGIPSTTLEKTNTHTHIQNGLMKITQPETELPHKRLQTLLMLNCNT